jgi:CRP-like cAMP-binding protein
MRAFTHDTDGNEVSTFFYASNTYVFEVSSLFMRRISTESIQALTPCHGYSISFDTLNTLFHSSPEFRDFGRMMLVKAFAAFKQRSLELINQSAEARYANLRATQKEVTQYAPLKHIASYLGITDSSLSRIRKEFSKK